MDTQLLTALDNIDGQVSESLIPTQPFSPPSLSSSQSKQLELLQHLSLYSELLILVCADKGMGKTFIAKALLASREIPDQSLMFEADFSLSYLDVLHNLAQFLDLADLADDIDGIEQQVLAQCLQIAEEEQGSVLLIIDQADQLSDDILADINQLALLAPNALHIMLLAPLGFENKLLALAEPQAPFHVLEVEPLIDDEAEILLLEQFPEKEWAVDQVDYIVQQSVGNPGKILYLAQRLLSGVKPPQKTSEEATKFPVTHIAAMLLVGSALGVAYFYQNKSIVPVIEKGSVVVEANALSPSQPPPTLADSTLDKNETVPSVVAVEKIEEVAEVDFNFIQNDAVDVPQAQKTISSASLLKGDASLKEPILKEAGIKKPVSQESKVIYSKDENVILSANNAAFVIQLFGSYSSVNAQKFIAENTTKTIQLRSYQTRHQGKPWYVVIAGPFESRAVATQQSQRLTEKLRQQKLWIRSISPIQLNLQARK